MKTEEITEGNLALLEFMGVAPQWTNWTSKWSWGDGIFFSVNDNSREKVLKAMGGYAKYSSSWDWLMPVVEKIESLNYSTEIYSMGSDNHRMAVYSGGAIVTQSKLMESKIKSVFSACVKFAEWYKKQ